MAKERPITELIWQLDGQSLNATQIYEALLELGFTGEKYNVYNTISKLCQKGLITCSYAKTKPIYYIKRPQPPMLAQHRAQYRKHGTIPILF